jgi:hypothetical protein
VVHGGGRKTKQVYFDFFHSSFRNPSREEKKDFFLLETGVIRKTERNYDPKLRIRTKTRKKC